MTGPKIPNIPNGTIFPLNPSILYSPNMPSDPLTLYPLNIKPPNFPPIPMSFMDKIRKFLKSDFYFFMTYYLKFIIIFSICFYILLNVSSKTDSIIIKIETKIFFYIIIGFLFLVSKLFISLTLQ